MSPGGGRGPAYDLKAEAAKAASRARVRFDCREARVLAIGRWEGGLRICTP